MNEYLFLNRTQVLINSCSNPLQQVSSHDQPQMCIIRMSYSSKMTAIWNSQKMKYFGNLQCCTKAKLIISVLLLIHVLKLLSIKHASYMYITFMIVIVQFINELCPPLTVSIMTEPMNKFWPGYQQTLDFSTRIRTFVS